MNVISQTVKDKRTKSMYYETIKDKTAKKKRRNYLCFTWGRKYKNRSESNKSIMTYQRKNKYVMMEHMSQRYLEKHKTDGGSKNKDDTESQQKQSIHSRQKFHVTILNCIQNE